MPDVGGDQRQRTVEDLFDSASDLAADQRNQYLDATCGSNPAIRAEVERLLAYHDKIGLLDSTLVSSASNEERFLQPGDLLSSRFRIVRSLGSGGMGCVYEAEDLTSGIRVALKTIRSEATADERMGSRLRRELQICRNVSHSNVCKVFEYWEAQEESNHRITFFTMELLHGDTLACKLASSGPLNEQQAIALLKQIGCGLNEVHRLGIVHGDLKPANIFLVRESAEVERAVVMDFGLAKNFADANLSQTQSGAPMGTPLYMAPEQFEGKSASVASDVYSFGVLAFELVTGRNHPLVPPRSLVSKLSSSWDKTLLTCFEREPQRRPSTVMQVLERLENRGGRTRQIVHAVTVSVLCCLAGGAYYQFGPEPRQVGGATQLTFDSGFTADPATSADGKLLVYASDRNAREGDLNIWLQQVDSGKARQVTFDPGDEDEPAISPDGKLIAYRSGRNSTLFTRALDHGPPIRIADWTEAPRFSPDGKTLVFWTGHTSSLGQIWLAPTSGGVLTRFASEFADARFPVWSPDGKWILFRGARSAWPSTRVNSDWWVTDSAGKTFRATGAGDRLRRAGLLPHESPPTWDGSSVVFSGRAGQSTNLWSLPLSSKFPKVFSRPTPITTGSGFQVLPSFLHDGRIAFAEWRRSVHIWRINSADGEIQQVTQKSFRDSSVSASRDGTRLAFGRRLGDISNVWIKDTRTGEERELATNETAIPFISPGGERVAFSSSKTIRMIQTVNGQQSTICTDCGELLGWMPDKSAVIYVERKSAKEEVIKALVLATKEKQTLLTGQAFHEVSVSPDQKLIAFSVWRSNNSSQIFVSMLQQVSPSLQPLAVTSPDTWSEKPTWSASGNQIRYLSNRDGFWCIWSQSIHPTTKNRAEEPTILRHFHAAAFTLSHLTNASACVAEGGATVFLCVGSEESNIWSVHP